METEELADAGLVLMLLEAVVSDVLLLETPEPRDMTAAERAGLGASDGSDVGDVEGIEVGATDGPDVGDVEGMEVGVADGPRLG